MRKERLLQRIEEYILDRIKQPGQHVYQGVSVSGPQREPKELQLPQVLKAKEVETQYVQPRR